MDPREAAAATPDQCASSVCATSSGGVVAPRTVPSPPLPSPAPRASKRGSKRTDVLYAALVPCSNSCGNVARAPFAWTPGDRPGERRTNNGDVVAEIVVLHSKHESEGRLVVPVVARSLEAVMQLHSELPAPVTLDGDPIPVPPIFLTASVPPLSVTEYVQRLADNAYTSPSSLLGALILLDRYFRRVPSMRLTQMTCFKLFLTALRLSSKSMELRTLNNRHFAPVGGVTTRALNLMEAQMISDLNFDMTILPGEFAEYARRLWPSYVPIVLLPPS